MAAEQRPRCDRWTFLDGTERHKGCYRCVESCRRPADELNGEAGLLLADSEHASQSATLTGVDNDSTPDHSLTARFPPGVNAGCAYK